MIEVFREFKNLYEGILVHKKLKTKPRILFFYFFFIFFLWDKNPIINSIDSNQYNLITS